MLSGAAASANAGPGLIVGVDDDTVKWTDAEHMSTLLSLYAEAGVAAIRITLDWRPNDPALEGANEVSLQRADTAAAFGERVVVQVGGGPNSTRPLTATLRSAYCDYVAGALAAHPLIHDVVIWTEPNQPTFWRPPNAAAYEALLARCYDVLHQSLPDVNVIAASGPHQRIMGAVAPAEWYRRVGAALRRSNRRVPLFDTIGHNVYPDTPREPPATIHRGPSIDEGDYAKLLAALRTAFAGTSQPLPHRGGVSIWYMESGYQTTVDADPAAYHGRENVRDLLTPDQQARILGDAIRLAYCQPLVGAFFNFEFADDPDLVSWQSGILYADLTPKPAFRMLQQLTAQIKANAIRCPVTTAAHRR